MRWIDRLEKLGRLVFWLTLAGVCVVGLRSVLARANTMNELRNELSQVRASVEAAASRRPEPAPVPIPRLSLESMGVTMRTLDVGAATGRLFFSNVSSNAGVLCAVATVSSAAGAHTESLPECLHVGAYETGKHLVFHFARQALERICKEGDCEINIRNRADEGTSEVGTPAPSAVAAPAMVPLSSAATAEAEPKRPPRAPSQKVTPIVPAPTAAATNAVPEPDCEPPYTIDPTTGVRRLKPACAR
jgi:hypothetical protein